MNDRGTRNDSVTMLEEFYPTPSTIPAATRCLVLHVPDNDEWYGLAVGALWELMRLQNYEKVGIDVDLTIDRWLEVFRTMEVQCMDTTPIGATMLWWQSTPPPKWIRLQGTTPISKTTYPELFDIFGYSIGGGGDSFVLPSMANYSPIGVGTILNKEVAGAFTHTLSGDQIPAHTHGVRIVTGGAAGANNALVVTQANVNTTPTINTTNATGGGLEHNNLHPVRGCYFIIYAGR